MLQVKIGAAPFKWFWARQVGIKIDLRWTLISFFTGHVWLFFHDEWGLSAGTSYGVRGGGMKITERSISMITRALQN